MGTIIFDLDGTLVDTAPDLIDTLNVILGREGLPAVPYDQARALIGHGARRMLERGLAVAGRPVGNIDRMFGAFIAYYSEHVADRSRPFPGVEAALDKLAGRGCKFAVCTNKLEWLSVRLLKHLGLAGRFAAICGGTRSACKNLISERCWARCAAPAAASTAPSWSATRKPTSPPQGRPRCRWWRSISATRRFP